MALRDGRVAELPTPRPKKVVPERRGRFAAILAGGAVLLERRPPAGIWGGLQSLPELPEDADAADWVATRYGLAVQRVAPLAVGNAEVAVGGRLREATVVGTSADSSRSMARAVSCSKVSAVLSSMLSSVTGMSFNMRDQ